MSEWWREPQRIVQTNLRLVDANLDPERLAADLKARGATAMLFNVGGIFAWYPSALGLQAPNPFLDRDLVGDMIAAAHRQGIRVIGRYDLSKGTRTAYDAHPEWFCRDARGAPFEYNGTYQACVNGGWYQVQAPALLEESLGRYEIDGLFFNMFGYLAADYSYHRYGLCHCDNCRSGFRDFAGADLPERHATDDPLYRKYLAFQDATSLALSEKIRQTVKTIRPGVAVSNMGKNSDFFRGELNRRLDRVAPEWVHQSGEQARLFRSLGGGRIRYSSALTHFIDFPWRYSAETAAAQALRLAQQLANGADPHYYFMGSPDQPDRKALPVLRQVFEFHARNEALYAQLQSAARIGLYSSARSRRYDPRGSASAHNAFRGAYRALVDAGLSFDLISDTRGREPDFAATHAGYDTIILAGASCLSDEEAGNLDAYAEAGGCVLSFGATGTCDEMGEKRAATPLCCAPFSSIAGRVESMRGGYATMPEGGLAGLDSDLMLVDGVLDVVTPGAGAEVLCNALAPQRFGPPELCFPEDGASETVGPAVLVGPYGTGRAIHVPWQADELYYAHSLAEHRALIAELASRFTRPAPVRLSRPSRLELTVQRHEGKGQMVVHVVNYSGQCDDSFDEPVTIHGLELKLRDVAADRCRALVAGCDIDISKVDAQGVRTVVLPPVHYFEVVTIPDA